MTRKTITICRLQRIVVEFVAIVMLCAGTVHHTHAALPESDAADANPVEQIEIPISPLDDPPAGEDVDARQASLEQVATGMRKAQQLLAARRSTLPAQRVQKQIVRDLDALIDQLEQQQKKPGQKPGGGKQSGGRQQQQSQARRRANSEQAATDSIDQPGGAAGEQVDMQEMRRLMNQVWGQLPDRLRSAVPQSWSEEFLPKYELEIEKYYRRLVEEPEPTGP